MAEARRKPQDTKPAAWRSLFLLTEQGKVGRLRKTLLRELALLGGLLTLLVGALYFLSGWENQHTQSRDLLSAALEKLTSDTDTMQQRLTKAEKALPKYETLFKDQAKPEIALDRQQAAQIIERLKEEYLFASLRVSMSPVSDMLDGKFKNKFVLGQSVELGLTIEALSDEHVLNFLAQLKRELPGKIKVLKLTFTKLTDPTPQMLALVLQSGKVGMVKSEIKLQWMGLKLNPSDGATPPAPPPPMQGGGA